MKKWEQFSINEIEQFIRESKSYTQLAIKCGYNPNFLDGIRQMIEELNLDVSHFKGQGWLNGETYASTRYVPFEEYIKGKHVQTNKVRQKLLK